MINKIESAAGTMQHFALNIFIEKCSKIWIMDDGASNHISSNVKLFDFFYDMKKHVLVILSNGSFLHVTKARQVTISTKL